LLTGKLSVDRVVISGAGPICKGNTCNVGTDFAMRLKGSGAAGSITCCTTSATCAGMQFPCSG